MYGQSQETMQINSPGLQVINPVSEAAIMSFLEMRNISKAFGGTKAVDDVSFFVEEGEVHALLGENGAGKSTLMNILTGVISSDSGSITFNGKSYFSPGIREMEDAGIAFVHQELNLITGMTVWENIFLCRELLKKNGLLDKKSMIKETETLFEKLGVDIDPAAMINTLTTAQKQLVEICRALYGNASLLILDEPTTALGNEEISHLFEIIRNLKKEGKSFIFISHKMPEIFEISDSYTVLRNGKFVSSGQIKDTSPQDIVLQMVGEQTDIKDIYKKRTPGNVILELNDFSGDGFSHINLSVREGEIIAFTGLAGCGASECLQTMFGARVFSSGSMSFKGKKIYGSIPRFMKSGVAMLPSDRKENSVISDLNILENMYIAEHAISGNRPFINKERELQKYNRFKDALRIKAQSPQNGILSLSGGNQQKVFLARWLNTNASLILLDNPTQGVDIRAKSEIYRLILDLAEQGKTIILFTLEVPEIMKVADKCVIFYEGSVSTILEHDQIDEKNVLAYSTNACGGKHEKDKESL